MSTFRKLLLTMLLVSLTGSAFGAGTFASFTASTTNASSTFASGTLVLSNKVESGTLCLSTGGTLATPTRIATAGGNQATCDLLFPIAANKPGHTPVEVDVDIKNEGNLDSTGLKLAFIGTGLGGLCASVDTGPADGVADSVFHGDGDLCPNVKAMIQEYSDLARTTPTACPFGDNDDGTVTTCDGLATSHTLSDLDAFLDGSPLSVSTLNANTAKYYRITLQLHDTGSPQNDLQGRKVSFQLKWSIST